MARRKCSVETYSSLNFVASSKARSNTRRRFAPISGSTEAPPTFEYLATSAATSASTCAGAIPNLLRMGLAPPPSCPRAALLPQQRDEEVLGGDFGVPGAAREVLGVDDGLLRLDR